VHQTLFGFARARVGYFLEQHWKDPAVQEDVVRLKAERTAERSEPAPAWSDDPAGVVRYVHWLMDRDRKSTGLKSLQGKIWEEGYRSGELRGEVYPDVPPALARWHQQGIRVAIFSSGSIQAQQSLFRTTPAGDLTRFLSGYFDTTTGPKSEPESYARIAAALERSAPEVLFVSDVIAEVDAARTARLQTGLCIRKPGLNPPTGSHAVIGNFDQLF